MCRLVAESLRLLAEKKDVVASAIENIFNTKTMATLKISDLSVGDWVQDNYGDYIKVAGIWQGCNFNYQVDVFRDGRIGTIVPCNLHPIPITAEILERNGWSNDGMYATLRIDEHRHLEYYYHEHRLCKWYCGVDEWQNHAKVNDITFAAHCYSVHQLQHALRLAGVEKEINL